MSDLQLILIILGAFIIAGVLVYNWLQEKKLHKQVNNEFIVPQKDVLTEDFYIDTDAYVEKELAELPSKIKHQVLDDVADSATKTDKTAFSYSELEDAPVIETPYKQATNAEVAKKELKDSVEKSHSVDENVSNASSVNQAFKSNRTSPKPIEPSITADELDNAPPSLPSEVHPQIDLTAILYVTNHIASQALYDMAESLDDIALPMMIYGLDSKDKWHLVDLNNALNTDTANADGSALTFKQVTCSLQLADRGGPVTKSALNKFQFAVESAGLELNAHVEWQGSGDVLNRAVEIDQFCVEVDQLINVHVAQHEMPIHGTKFRGLVEANGMVLNNDGKFYYISNDPHSTKLPLFCAIDGNNQAFTAESLRNNVLKEVIFQLEIPKVPNCEQAFNQMITVAQKLSNSLNARLVDDNQKPLGDLQIEKIRQQLKVIHATMVARGIMPGSPASMRLFN
ncbi:MAG: cell division protein ZipA C-terminal FtsZ-binding domain-containing protein [Pseudomonadota bacterium]